MCDFYVVGQKNKASWVLYDAREGFGGRAVVTCYTIQQLIQQGYSVCGVQKTSKSTNLRPSDITVVNQQGKPATRIPTHEDVPDVKRSASTVARGLKRTKAEKQKAKAAGEKRSQTIQTKKRDKPKNPLLEVYKLEQNGGIKRLTTQMVGFLYSLLIKPTYTEFEQLYNQNGQPLPVYYSKTEEIAVTRTELETAYEDCKNRLGLTPEGYVSYSFYPSKGTRNTPEEIAHYLLQHTDKPIRYTYGFKWKDPTTCEVPITREQALQYWPKSWTNVTEYADYVEMQQFSENDMW